MQGYPPNYGQVAGVPQSPVVHPTAKWAMWTGVASVLCWLTAPIALGLGLLSNAEIKKDPARFSNASQAKIGIVIGAIGTGLLVLAMIVGAVSKGGSSAVAAKPKAAADGPVAPEPHAERATEAARPVRPAPVEVPAVSVTSMELFSAYDGNEVSADAAYKGKQLNVTGRITGIDKDFADNIIVKLQTPNQFMSVMAYGMAAEAAGALRKGQQITLTCRGDGRIVGSPVLRDCR